MKGSVRHIGNPGSWYYSFAEYAGGKRVAAIKRGGYRTKKEADAALAEAIDGFNKGDRRAAKAPSTQPLGDWLDAWLAGRTDVKPSTRDGYATVIRAWIVPTLGAVALRDITPERLAGWLAGLRASGGKGGRPLGARSVQLSWRVLSMALDDAVEGGKLPVSPCAQVPKRQRPKPERRGRRVEQDQVWTGDEAAAFLAATSDDRLHPLYALALDTGARRGELCGLRWATVDLDAGVATFERNRVLVDGEPVEGTLKNDQPKSVTLDPRTVALLRGWRRRQLEDRMRAGEGWATEGHVFTDETGGALRPDHVSYAFDRAVEAASLPAITFHGLRHTAATVMLLAGVPPLIAAGRLGHDPAVLLSTYAHFVPGDDSDAAAVLGRAIYGAGS